MVAGGYRRQLDRIFLVTLVLIAVLMKGGTQVILFVGPTFYSGNYSTLMKVVSRGL